MDESEKKMLEEVALRNAIAKFKRINAATTKRAATPKVGIFWIDDLGTMFAASVSLRDAVCVDYGDFKIFEKGHAELWDAAIRANPQWRGKEYEEVPRGRVVYRRHPKTTEFIVYMSKRIARFRKKVMSRFSLPKGCVHFDFSDQHYRMTDNKRGLKFNPPQL